MEQYKRPTIADREDDYRARRRAQVLSPDRIDPFMDGTYLVTPPILARGDSGMPALGICVATVYRDREYY